MALFEGYERKIDKINGDFCSAAFHYAAFWHSLY